MTRMEKLLSISSEALGHKLLAAPAWRNIYHLGPELFHMLELKNGFYTFEQALHVFPSLSDVTGSMTLEEWNSDTLWRSAYDDMTTDLLFFAEDVFGDQFCLAKNPKGVLRFYAETGERALIADSIEEWSKSLLSDYEVETGWPLAHQWQARNGTLELGHRLQPKIPFVYGGAYALDNLWAGDSVKGMLFKGELARKIKDLPDGTRIQLKVREQNPLD